jgi:hypothetical protein
LGGGGIVGTEGDPCQSSQSAAVTERANTTEMRAIL